MIHGGINKFRNGQFYVRKEFVVHKNVLETGLSLGAALPPSSGLEVSCGEQQMKNSQVWC